MAVYYVQELRCQLDRTANFAGTGTFHVRMECGMADIVVLF